MQSVSAADGAGAMSSAVGLEYYSLMTHSGANRTLSRMVGRELRKAREAAGLSQEQLAFKAGVHRTYVSMLERDKKSPTLAVLFRLCAALGVSPSRFVARVEDQRSR